MTIEADPQGKAGADESALEADSAKPPPTPTLQIELPPDLALGVYANQAFININQMDFTLDFAATVPFIPASRIVARVIMSPPHAKALLSMLSGMVKEYEQQIGRIPAPPIPVERERDRIGFKPQKQPSENSSETETTEQAVA